ncbi:hypothetical protein [Alteromonas sp. a30]|uniref:hypothetical protein n=1 Tax=Alteromonas sp. a30 TaxID=2730917 RepID=UPI002282DC4C|nr:hypothetical protein [Alteromonas sp. a30]MCY7296237.1 hypothetical protein [Alteromonas sp. a30]
MSNNYNRALAITEAMRASITIHKFIYHILITEEEEVDYLSAVDLTETQKEFFTEMIAESSRGTKYTFVDADNAPLNEQCVDLVGNLDDDDLFLRTSERIAHNFKAQHDKRMADGIVIVTTFSMLVNLQPQNFVAIIKLDYKPVLQQIRDEDDPTKVSFEEITDSLLEEKAAIQKRAIIDVGDSFNWDVIAVERGKTGAKQDTDVAIGDHFKNFLCVRLLEDNTVLMRRAISHSKKWATQHEELIPSDVKARVVSYMEAHDAQSINMDDIKELICNHDTPETQSRLEASFDSYMDGIGLNGAQFTPSRNSIPKKDKKTKLKTNMNVTVEWLGKMEDVGVKQETRNNRTVITITADNVDDIS